MARILIIYEHPKAIPDIFKWADKKGINLDVDKAWHNFEHKEDYISIIPIESACHYMHTPIINKLVLFGSFKRQDIINISQIIIKEN